jgi:phosphatidylserine/phosphatidylglycerophosphate/cardiolipin synthase-like enzyme
MCIGVRRFRECAEPKFVVDEYNSGVVTVVTPVVAPASGVLLFRLPMVVSCTITLVLGLAPPALAWEPSGKPVFNDPWGTAAAKWRIVDYVNKAINRSHKGSTVYVSSYLFDAKSSADALIRARNRGVKVRVVLDGDNARNQQSRRVKRVLNRDNVWRASPPKRWGRDQSFLVHCDGGCRGNAHNNHTKFYVFTHTGTARNVVMVSSSNLNKGGATRGYNDLLVAKRRATMVKQYARIHAEMANDSPRVGERYRSFVNGRYTSRFYPKPHGSDPVMTDLEKVRCRGVRDGAGRNGRTAINVSMFAWNGTRGESIARKLVRLARERGCDVRIVYGAPSRTVKEILSKAARNGRIRLWDSRFDRDDDGLFDVRVHHKYMLINGHYGADRSAWRVHTGSQNWGRGTLRGGDENTLSVVSRLAYRYYMRNWRDVVREHARQIHR